MLRAPLLRLGWAVLAAAVAGLLLDAAFPALGWWPLAFPAIILALLALVGRRFWAAVLVGGVFGLAFYLPHVSWAGGFLGGHPLAWVPWGRRAGAWASLVALLSPMITLACRWVPQWRDTARVRLVLLPLVVAGAWMTRELVVGSWPYGGFPWGRVAMSQADSPVAPVASWIGVTGLGWLMVVLCAAFLEAVRWWRGGAHRRLPGRSRPGSVAAAAIAVPALVLLLLAVPAFPTSPAGTIRVGAVQGDGPAAYVDRAGPLAVLESQLAASEPLQGEQLDLVLWPEGSVDRDPMADPETTDLLDAAARRYGAPILLNAASTSGASTYNTSFLWTENGPVATHLVSLLEREYAHGTDLPLLAVDDTQVVLAICFDVVFDDVVLAAIRNDAQVFMSQTNNAAFRGTAENLQQLDFARMRAIETGRSVINLSTTGTSQAFAPDGSVLQALPVDEPGLILLEVELRDGRTPGTVVNPLLRWLLPLGTVTALAGLGIRARLRAVPKAVQGNPQGRRDVS